ncbi:LppX_LprAFG lipoprotein [Pseudonocardia bannensis]|uniref:LppX_LprAFG lipoprotein n=1 Tax=Pseudonocardia bannensis TaxID=630973 RepID=A0A848DFY9_9PSEU|nr:LppX_LprAFG lipoprotein [Pseudonocardia bannensis]NMH91474.1 LppX_LprAFG lipoprotein [Pseudonocardia bannensis]
MRSSRLLTTVAAVALLLPGCSGAPGGPAGELPAATDLLSRSAAAMARLTSVGMDVLVDPGLTNVPVRGATGSLTASGDAVGSATVTEGDAPVELEFVVVGGSIYLKGPTGGFSPPIPVSLAAAFYDPTAALDPRRGLARLLATATPGGAPAREIADGIDSYRVPAAFGPDTVATLAPGVRGTVNGVLWIDVATSRLVKAELQVPGGPGGATGPVTVRLRDFDAPVTVTAPV